MANSKKIKEQIFVEECFKLFSSFSHSKIKEIIDKEKECSRNLTVLWSSFLNQLAIFAELERAFYSLSFISSSSIGRFLSKREENLKARYSCLLSELRKIEFTHKENSSPPSNTQNKTLSYLAKRTSQVAATIVKDVDIDVEVFTSVEQLVAVVCQQFQNFVLTRMNVISFYEQLATLNSGRNVNMEDLLKVMSTTCEDFLVKVHNPIVLAFKDTYRVECETVQHLLQTQIHLSKVNFLQSLLSLQAASQNLQFWSQLSTFKVKKLPFGSNSNKSSHRDLYEWLLKLKQLLLAKFNLYFFEILLQHMLLQELKSTISKTSYDFCNKMIMFAKKEGALSVMLIYFSPQPLNNGSLGYVLSNNKDLSSSKEQKDERLSLEVLSPFLTSDTSFPFQSSVLFIYAPEKQDVLMKKGCEMLEAKISEFQTTDRPIYCHNQNQSVTYVLMRVEGPIYMVSILGKRCNKYSINNFYSSIVFELRCFKHFNGIKSDK